MHFLTTTFLLLPVLGGVLGKSPDTYNYNYNYDYPPHHETTTSTYTVTMPCYKCHSPEPQISYPTAPPPYPTAPSYSIQPVYSSHLKSEYTVPVPEHTKYDHKTKTHHYYPPYPIANSTMVTYPIGTATGTGTAVIYSTKSSSKETAISSSAAGTSAVATQSSGPGSGSAKVRVGSVLALVVVAGVGLVL
ncbi:hypothetical protein BDD12DRAFT_829827 [Trichophaea hybrida]|nr:hypothetical protein BDD12DRAFT_829827 [Trichophaea hybrida]